MSKPRSQSRSPTSSSPGSSQSPQQHIHDLPIPRSGASIVMREESFSLRPSLPASALSPDSEIAPSGQRQLIRLAESTPSNQRMAKRPRTDTSSTTTESQSWGPQDTQATAAGPSSIGGISVEGEQTMPGGTFTPPKKKRTRTLTTPHQAAVLHSLLAQSRFPTTAMREEVGRSIGLSARKVQIWFQNQRQKARRPRNQSEASSSRSQPYGAFPSVSPYGPGYTQSETNFLPHLPPLPPPCGSLSMQSSHNPILLPEPYPSLSDPPSQLLGPGVPGLEPHPSNAPFGITGGSILRPRIGPLDSGSGPTASHDPYRTLPPLPSGPHGGMGISEPRPIPQPVIEHLPIIDNIVHPAERPFIHYRPMTRQASSTSQEMPSSGSDASGSIPPPFTLEPPPQWDAKSFAPSLARSGMWPSRSPKPSSPTPTFFIPPQAPPLSTSVSTSRLNQGISGERELIVEETQSPQKRVGRYDPVRATVIQPSPSSPSPPPPASD